MGIPYIFIVASQSDSMLVDLREHNARYEGGVSSQCIISMHDSYKPDPDWIHVDQAGHIHKWGPGWSVPTLKHVTDETEWVDDDEYGGYLGEIKGHEECKWCGEHVVPRQILDVPAYTPISIPTLVEYSGEMDGYAEGIRAFKEELTCEFVLPGMTLVGVFTRMRTYPDGKTKLWFSANMKPR